MNGARRYRPVVRLLVLSGLLGLLCVAPRAQSGKRFRGRRSVLPIDVAAAQTMSGWGKVPAALTTDTLVITGTFDGLSSPATLAHIHQAPPARRGPVVFAELEVTHATSGEVDRTVELDALQIQQLRDSGSYLQMHTENNPGGAIRGLMPQTSRQARARAPAGYQASQAQAGEAAYRDVCASCHQRNLGGAFEAPELAGASFLSLWRGRPARDLFDYIKVAMPPAGRKPSDATLTDIVAYILRQNGMDAGDSPLAATSDGAIGEPVPSPPPTDPLARRR